MAGDIAWAYSGKRYRLGYRADAYELWDNQLAYQPLERFPRTDDGWRAAWDRFQTLEPEVEPAPQDRGSVSGEFKKYRVVPFRRHGAWRNDGTLEVTPESITIQGRHVWPLGRRALIVLAVFAVDVAMLFTLRAMYFGFVGAYLIVEYVTLTREQLTYPWDRVLGYAVDPSRTAVAIEVADGKYRSPFVLKSPEYLRLLQVLREADPGKDRNPALAPSPARSGPGG